VRPPPRATGWREATAQGCVATTLSIQCGDNDNHGTNDTRAWCGGKKEKLPTQKQIRKQPDIDEIRCDAKMTDEYSKVRRRDEYVKVQDMLGNNTETLR
jgi:hypothetical protein